MSANAVIEFDNTKFAAQLNGSVASNARKLGISRQHLNNIVRGHRKPSADLLLKIQHIFEISPDKMLRVS